MLISTNFVIIVGNWEFTPKPNWIRGIPKRSNNETLKLVYVELWKRQEKATTNEINMGKEDTELTALRKELNDLIEKFKVFQD